MTIDMKHLPPPERKEAIARAGLASLKGIASLEGPPSDRALAVMRGVRDSLMRVDVDLDGLAPIDPGELAAAVPETEWRERILRGMTLVALLDGEPTEAQLAWLDRAAEELGVDDAPVRTFREVLRGRLQLVRIDILRRGFLRPAIGAYVKLEGARGLFHIAEGLLSHEDAALAARYHALDDYPEGTFGRAYADFIARNRFSFPGEAGGPPPPVMRHDCCHVLGGYGTTPAEECAVLSFQAGFEQADPFFVMLFGLAQFELGIGASPLLPGVQHAADPETMLAALEHGSHVNVDLIGDPSWDPWDHFHEPIDELRAALDIPPRGREPIYPDFDD